MTRPRPSRPSPIIICTIRKPSRQAKSGVRKGGHPLLWTSGKDYSLINYGLIESVGTGNGGAKGIAAGAINRFINYGTMHIVGTDREGADGTYLFGGYGGVTNYGLIEVSADVGLVTGVRTARDLNSEISFENYGTISARNNGPAAQPARS